MSETNDEGARHVVVPDPAERRRPGYPPPQPSGAGSTASRSA